MVSRRIKALIPKDRSELVPIFLTFFLICLYVTFELSVILPAIYHNVFTFKEILHLCFGLFVIYNVMGNLFLSMVTDTSTDTIICPVLLPPPTVQSKVGSPKEQEKILHHCNWHYCYQCEVNVPARAEHCHICRKCVLKRDHHCAFLGRCVGFRSVRYYLCFLIWTAIGLIYCNILHADYTYELVGTLSWRMIIACVFPLGAWAFGLLNHFSLFLSLICSTSVLLSCYILFLIVQHFYLILNSQTWYEYENNIHLYNRGATFRSNLLMIFGKRWYLVMFSPWISSSPIGDGMTFDMNFVQYDQ